MSRLSINRRKAGMRSKLRKLGTSVALVATAFITTSAAAEEFSLPGHACIEDAASLGNLAYELERAVNTSSTQDAVLRCPVFRDPPDASTITALSVSGTDNNPAVGRSVECFLRSCDINAGSCAVSSTLSSGAGSFVLNFNSAIDGDPDGFAYYTCTVPPTSGGVRSSVRAYTWDD